MLSIYASSKRDWDLKLPLLLFAYGTSLHSSTNFSPSRLTFGWEAHVPLDLMFGPLPGEKLSPKGWVTDLQKDLRRAFSLCREHISSAQKPQKASYDRDLKAKYMQYEPGARVMLFDPTVNNPWKEPFRVIERTGIVTYKIEIGNGKKMHENYDRLKGCTKRFARLLNKKYVFYQQDSKRNHIYRVSSNTHMRDRPPIEEMSDDEDDFENVPGPVQGTEQVVVSSPVASPVKDIGCSNKFLRSYCEVTSQNIIPVQPGTTPPRYNTRSRK